MTQSQGNSGVCIWLTGLSGAGKTSIAKAVVSEINPRPVTLIDGDLSRETLSKGLGFTREDRNTHISRVAYVASEVVRHGGIVICAVISPYSEGRKSARKCVEGAGGRFVEVYVNTPLEVCERRDTKGLYAKARNGEISLLTGIGDVYEAPENPDIAVDTNDSSPQELAKRILALIGDK